ncbi:MAG: malate dehydrogenase [Candidatus Omnitrophota bacterium]
MITKLSIIGAGGVGSTLAFHVLSRVPVKELVLIDILSNVAKGIVLDLEDTRSLLPFCAQVIGTDDFSHLRDSDIVVITAGIARKEGMTRLDLLKINAKVTREVSLQIKQFAKNAIVIVVTNPLDLITYVVTKQTSFPRERVIGMGSSLDTARLLNLFSKCSTVGVSSLEGFVFGQHNNDMIVSMDRLRIKGEAISSFLNAQEISTLQEKTAHRGGEIVELLKNRSATFAPSLACCRLIEAIAEDKNEIIPVSVMLNGEYGLKDVCVGVPCLINRKGVEKVIELSLSPEEKKKLAKVNEAFQDVYNV